MPHPLRNCLAVLPGRMLASSSCLREGGRLGAAVAWDVDEALPSPICDPRPARPRGSLLGAGYSCWVFLGWPGVNGQPAQYLIST